LGEDCIWFALHVRLAGGQSGHREAKAGRADGQPGKPQKLAARRAIGLVLQIETVIDNPRERRGQRATLGRLWTRLHVRGLIARVPRTRRWHIVREALDVLGAVVQLYHHGIPAVLATAA
jgi:hypothetical protein